MIAACPLLLTSCTPVPVLCLLSAGVHRFPCQARVRCSQGVRGHLLSGAANGAAPVPGCFLELGGACCCKHPERDACDGQVKSSVCQRQIRKPPERITPKLRFRSEMEMQGRSRLVTTYCTSARWLVQARHAVSRCRLKMHGTKTTSGLHPPLDGAQWFSALATSFFWNANTCSQAYNQAAFSSTRILRKKRTRHRLCGRSTSFSCRCRLRDWGNRHTPKGHSKSAAPHKGPWAGNRRMLVPVPCTETRRMMLGAVPNATQFVAVWRGAWLCKHAKLSPYFYKRRAEPCGIFPPFRQPPPTGCAGNAGAL